MTNDEFYFLLITRYAQFVLRHRGGRGRPCGSARI